MKTFKIICDNSHFLLRHYTHMDVFYSYGKMDHELLFRSYIQENIDNLDTSIPNENIRNNYFPD